MTGRWRMMSQMNDSDILLDPECEPCGPWGTERIHWSPSSTPPKLYLLPSRPLRGDAIMTIWRPAYWALPSAALLSFSVNYSKLEQVMVVRTFRVLIMMESDQQGVWPFASSRLWHCFLLPFLERKASPSLLWLCRKVPTKEAFKNSLRILVGK